MFILPISYIFISYYQSITIILMTDRIIKAKNPWFKHFIFTEKRDISDIDQVRIDTFNQIKELKRQGKGIKRKIFK